MLEYVTELRLHVSPKSQKTQFTKCWIYSYSLVVALIYLHLWICQLRKLTLKHALPNSQNRLCIAIHKTAPVLCP